MIPRKLNLFIGAPAYGGNGGTASVVPDVATWLADTVAWAKGEPRIDKVWSKFFSDTPLTMLRNQIVQTAKRIGADLLVMVDSDMKPDLYDGKPRFMPTAFDFQYEHYERGPLVLMAPYGGPPPHEVPYVFYWANQMNDAAQPDMKMEMYTRHEAATRSGIEPIACGPTGLIMIDMRVFDILTHPYFDYEYADKTESEKVTTEDCYMTRNVALYGQQLLGYNPCHILWDCWAGHHKPKVVGKPQLIDAASVNEQYRKYLSQIERGETVRNVTMPEWLRNRIDSVQVVTNNGG